MITNKSIGSYGRFGNLLFQMAAVIGIARSSGQDFGFAPIVNADHRDRFGSTEDCELDKYFANSLPQIDGRHFQERHHPWGYSDLYLPVGDWDIRGHFQSEKYFKHCIDEVRYWLTFKDEPPLNDYVAIHYRAGDYEEGGKNVYHPRCSREYYEKAMALFPGRKYLLFSDDITGFKKLLGLTDVDSIESGYIDDFKLMKSCHSFICANSSYSLMAAILANQPSKQMVAPALWFGDPAGGIKMDYPENCIVI